MPEIKLSKCKCCKADVFWIQSKGKNQIVDAKPKMGYVFIEGSHVEGQSGSLTLDQGGSWVFKKLYESHFATCPCADKFRKKG